MADKQHRRAAGPPFMLQQAQYLQLHRHIQRGRRFISNNQLRLAGKSQRDHHPLAHTAGKLKREARHDFGGVRDLHLLQ
ncbi:hypothetical protein D3C81_2108590 [compost metagenome]